MQQSFFILWRNRKQRQSSPRTFPGYLARLLRMSLIWKEAVIGLVSGWFICTVGMLFHRLESNLNMISQFSWQNLKFDFLGEKKNVRERTGKAFPHLEIHSPPLPLIYARPIKLSSRSFSRAFVRFSHRTPTFRDSVFGRLWLEQSIDIRYWLLCINDLSI